MGVPTAVSPNAASRWALQMLIIHCADCWADNCESVFSWVCVRVKKKYNLYADMIFLLLLLLHSYYVFTDVVTIVIIIAIVCCAVVVQLLCDVITLFITTFDINDDTIVTRWCMIMCIPLRWWWWWWWWWRWWCGREWVFMTLDRNMWNVHKWCVLMCVWVCEYKKKPDEKCNKYFENEKKK